VAIRLVNEARKAHERQKSLVDLLDRHAVQLEGINALVRAIFAEESLQTAVVAAELTKVSAAGQRLVRCLKALQPGRKGPVGQLVHQLAHGTADKETLADIMTDLDRAKASLGLSLHLANVGLTRMVGDTLLANTAVVHRIDRLLVDVVRDGQGLSLACLLKNASLQGLFGTRRFPLLLCQEADDVSTHIDDEDSVLLRKDEVASLGRQATWSSSSSTAFDGVTIDRIIVGNMARDSAVQILGPVGADLWEDVRTRIEQNTASGHAIQIAYPTDFDTFKYLLDRQDRQRRQENW
jgi:hypothetical protein